MVFSQKSWFLLFSIFTPKGAQRDQKVTCTTLILQEHYLIQGDAIGKERTFVWKWLWRCRWLKIFLHKHRDATFHNYGKIKHFKTKRKNCTSKQGAISSLLVGNEKEKSDEDEKEIIQFERLIVENWMKIVSSMEELSLWWLWWLCCFWKRNRLKKSLMMRFI